ncbi:hypothetical protein ACLESD_38195 [Pyxidicoccus sp. 3LFB2]
MTPRFWMCLVALLAAPVVHGQTSPLPSQDPEDPGYEQYDEGYDGTAPEEEDVPTAPYAPPELPRENPPAKPYAGAVWASGHWYWDGSEWRYNAGTWLAPMPGYRFINGYWEQDSQGWRWVSGGWARPDSTMVEIPVAPTNSEALSTTQAPPAPQFEAPPPAPAPELTWTPGYWYWSGDNWVWVTGTWVEPPQPNLVYVSPRWVRRGPAWFFSCGGWAVRGSVHVTVPVYRHASISVRWGHPYYFAHSWRRYPVVRHYEYRVHHGYRYREHGYRYQDNGYRHRDNGYRHRDNGYRHRDSGYRHRNNGYQHRDNGYRHRDNGYRGQHQGRGRDSRQHSASPGGTHSRNRGDRH